jgi:predicted DNA-binding ArsR family transcriptional regulator
VATNAMQGVSAPVYGSKHDQAIGIAVLKNLASVSGLKMIETKSITGGLAYETLNDAYTKLMAINNTANLNPEQKSLLEAFTTAWIAQHPEDGLKLNDATQALSIAKKVAAIFNKQIMGNYGNVNTATMNKTNVFTGGTSFPDPEKYKAFFEKQLSTEQLQSMKQEMPSIINPINNLSPTATLGFVQR